MPPDPTPEYSSLLKRAPVQRRSAARVEAILEASGALVEREGLDGLTMRSVADRAGVPTGTIYQFFPDRETLIQALALRYVGASLAPVEEVLALSGDWPRKIDGLVDAYAELLRRQPAMRTLWLAGVMDTATRRVAAEADDQIAVRLGAHLSEFAEPGATPTEADWRFLITLVSGLLKSAFAVQPKGDPALLARTKRVAKLYAADLLGAARPCRRP